MTGSRHSLARQFDEPDNAPIVVKQCACGADVRVSHVALTALEVFNAELARKPGAQPIELAVIRCEACQQQARTAGLMTEAEAAHAMDRIRKGWLPDAGTATALIAAGYGEVLAEYREIQAFASRDGDA